jgi:hypothetical protein
MVADNPTWGAPRTHGELRMLGFDLSERTISRWMKRAPRDPDRAKRWLAFLRNLREAIAAMDSFTVPTITLGVLYCHAALPIMPTSATSPFPLFCAKFLALLTNCIRHNPAVFSDLAVSPGNGGDQCRKILCNQVNVFKATRWSLICGRLSHPCWRTAMQMRPW